MFMIAYKQGGFYGGKHHNKEKNTIQNIVTDKKYGLKFTELWRAQICHRSIFYSIDWRVVNYV